MVNRSYSRVVVVRSATLWKLFQSLLNRVLNWHCDEKCAAIVKMKINSDSGISMLYKCGTLEQIYAGKDV